MYGDAQYPAQLVLQDVLTLHGSQFKGAALIVASPPCQGYSYRAMPWKKAKALGPPDNTLFETCFRIQREAIETAGHHIPLVVENVCGAQKWVGRARWHFGSFYLWGDVPALMPMTKRAKVGGIDFNDFKNGKGTSPAFNDTRHPAYANRGRNETHRRRSSTDAEGCSLGSAEAAVARSRKSVTYGSGTNQHVPEFASAVSGEHSTGIVDSMKATKNDGVKQHGSGAVWFDYGLCKHSSKSTARNAASAHIAKIPFALARHIAACWRPTI